MDGFGVYEGEAGQRAMVRRLTVVDEDIRGQNRGHPAPKFA